MTEELKVVLRRSEQHSGFGFSLLGTTGPPHVIYDIVENSPAADCGAVEAGDVILKVNGTDVHRHTTKEVLKCLRLSENLVTLELKRDPKLKARIKEQLNTQSPHYADIESPNIYDYSSSGNSSPNSTQKGQQQQRQLCLDSATPNNAAGPGKVGGSSSPALRYKSPSHLPSLRQNAATSSTQFQQHYSHSRNSSASSAKIQIVETTTTTTTYTTQGGVTSPTGSGATSPTFRPSRIPQALKCAPAPKPAPVLHSPQHKRPRPSQIPTKANGNASTNNGQSQPQIHHSNSYSGSPAARQRQQPDPEPNSAPPQPTKAPRFEAYMMTGDLILNLSRTPQTSNLLPAHAKKVDSLRDSPIRSVGRANGAALAPRASGESSPTSSSSVDSPTNTASSDSVNCEGKLQQRGHKQKQQQQQQQQQKDSINNSYNRRDSLTNDTLQLCEELERDEEVPQRYRRQQQQQRLHQQQQQEQSYEFYQNEDELEAEEDAEENDTHYDITNIETYQSGGGVGVGGFGAGPSEGDEDDSDRQCLVEAEDDVYDEDNDAGDEDYSTNSLGSGSAKQRLRALKQKSATRQHHRHRDAVDSSYGRAGHSASASTSSTTVKSEAVGVGGGGGGGANTSQDETSFSVPTSPISLSTPLIDKEMANSVPTSPEPTSSLAPDLSSAAAGTGGAGVVVRRHNGHVVRKCDSAGFRTSKSEDHLQQIQREGIAAVIPIDIDEDVNSSLNTLLDTRHDSEDSQASNRDRIVWTYNAPLQPHQLQQLQQQQQQEELLQQQLQQKQQQQSSQYYGQQSHSNSHSSSISSSPQHSVGSPASPTSVSSSVMSSSGSKGALGIGATHQPQSNGQALAPVNQVATPPTLGLLACPGGNSGGGNGGVGGSNNGGGGLTCGGDLSVSEAISNISSPDYQDDDNLLSSRDILGGMALSDPSDSDSTILVSDAAALQRQQQHQLKQQLKAQQQQQALAPPQSEHKLVIQVKGLDNSNNSNHSGRSAYSELKDSEDDVATLTDDPPTTTVLAGIRDRDASPPVSDDGSDVESLHSYHYSPKAVDMPSAIRLAKRLYSLDGFKKSDVSRHLSKNNDFSRAVADEYLKHFIFEKKTLDQALREFLQQFSLSGETQERERVLVHFSKRFLDCNPGTFNSQDACHTLTCAIMLLNTDLHGQNINRKMSCAEFVDNLADLNDGENFPKDVLKYLYQAIKTKPLEWALDEDATDLQQRANSATVGSVGQNPFLDVPESATAVEYKKGYVMRKCCFDSSYKKTPFGKRSWKMFYCTLRDLVLYLHKDEHGFRKSQMSDNLHNAIRIHHALATKANDYTKKQHVFRLQTADQAEYLFQTSDSKELNSWVETINFVCSANSAQPLEGGVGSQKRFQRPLLPSAQTKLLPKEQLDAHEQHLAQLEQELNEHKKGPIPSKGLPLQNYKEKESYLQYELLRYRSYVKILSAKLLADQQLLEQQQQQGQLSPTLEQGETFPRTVVPTPPSINIQLQAQPQPQQQQQQPQQTPVVQQSSGSRKEKKKK